MSFIQLTSPLILHADPILDMHAATKQYVDNKRVNVNASWFTTGVIPVARMPALSGDVSAAAGTVAMSLNTSGVTAGTYARVTVDATGRVTAGGTLVAADIPNVSWTKITTGRPTSASGYGITNLITLSGGSVSGNVSSSATPSAALHAVTKGYVDNAITGAVSASLSVGDVIRKPVVTSPAGFLRCNGSVVSRTTYAALFAVIGTTYNKATAGNSAGRPWRMQYDFNTQQSTDITGWTTTTALPATVGYAQAIVTNSRVYLMGGIVSGTWSSAVYTALINADGTLGSWSATTSLPDILSESQAIVTKNRVYLMGGIVGGGQSATVYTAPINADGTLGTWAASTSLPATVRGGQAIVTSSRVYLLGGQIANAFSDIVYTAPINTDGTLGSWVTTTSLPAVSAFGHAIVTSSRVYLMGGRNAGSNTAAVVTAPINADGTLGSWVTATSLPEPISNTQAIVTKNRVYLLGGLMNAAYAGTVYTAPINADGTLGTWANGGSFSVARDNAQAIVTSSRVFVIGGFNGSNSVSTVQTASFLGGFNDYTSYITQINVSVTDFTLPDFSTLEKNSLNYFIKF